MNGGEWSRKEEIILRHNFGRVSINELARMLPSRNEGAIVKRAHILGLDKNNARIVPLARSIEELERELGRRRAELNVENAEAQLAAFELSAPSTYKSIDDAIAKRKSFAARLAHAQRALFKIRFSQKKACPSE